MRIPSEEQHLSRVKRLREICDPLPGSIPYCNRRPIHVGGKYDGFTLIAFLKDRYPFIDKTNWLSAIENELIEIDGKKTSSPLHSVRAGNRIIHFCPDTVEPAVDTKIDFLYEDNDLLLVNKPAPLPVHPCGRYNKNSLIYLMGMAFPKENFHIVHRLDADTTGLLLLAKTKESARHLVEQFTDRTVKKNYLAKVQGRFEQTEADCHLAIDSKVQSGGRRRVKNRGLDAHSQIFLRRHEENNRSLLEVQPTTGRTNQIRLHLSSLGFPIIGDHTYDGSATDSGAGMSGQSRLHLHAWKLSLRHPSSGELLQFESKTPDWVQELN